MKFLAITTVILVGILYLALATDIAILKPSKFQYASAIRHATRFSDAEKKAIIFLRRYGYLSQFNESSSSVLSHIPLTRPLFFKALNNYQVMSNISPRNRLDDDTISSMSKVRCGNPDFRRRNSSDQPDSSKIARFEVIQKPWHKSKLSYRISKYPVGNPALSRRIVDNALRNASMMWSAVAKIDFVQLTDDDTRSSMTRADIDIKFERGQYDTDCEIYFQMGELAHATMMRSPAKMHFNGRVEWKIGFSRGNEVDLVAVAAHELGHVLGLDHSSDPAALMFASYRRSNNGLGRDDINGIQYLYGERKPDYKPSEPDKEPEQPSEPDPTPGSCPRTVTRLMPDGSLLCAVVYPEKRCGGQKLQISSGNKTSRLNGRWDNKISSAEVNPNCTLTICHRHSFTGGCIDINGENEGQNYNRLPLGYDDTISSLACICDEANSKPNPASVPPRAPRPPTRPPVDSEESEETDIGAELERGQEPPASIPNTNGIPTCAVMVTGFEPSATRAWIEEEVAPEIPENLSDVTFAYLATRRSCSLQFCTEPDFGGICEVVGPNRHVSSDEGFVVGSLSCECIRK